MIPLVLVTEGADGKEDVRRDRYLRDLHALECGRSKNEIAGSLGLSRNTVRKYVAAAEAAGMAPGGPVVSQQRWAELARQWFPELADTRLRQVTWPAIEEHRDYRSRSTGTISSRNWPRG